MKFRKLGWLSMCCLAVLLVSNVSSAEPRIGVIGRYEQGYLTSKGIEFGRLTGDDLLDIKKIEKYPALIYAGRPNAKHLAVIREYVKNGGIMYWGYPCKRDIAGAINAIGGSPVGCCFKVKVEKAHPITEGLEVGKWIPIEHPLKFLLKNYASTFGLSPQEKDCEVLLSVEVSKVEETGKNERDRMCYAPVGKRKTYPWLVIYKYGKGTVITGLYGMFRYEVSGWRVPINEVIDKLLLNLVAFLNEKDGQLVKAKNSEITSAKLFMEMIDCNKGQPKPIFLNGVKIGMVPDIYKGWSKSTPVEIPATSLHAIATKNSIQIHNQDRDPFKLRNLYLEVVDKNGNVIRSDTCADILCSFQSNWTLCEGRRAVYNGAPLPVFELTLPTEKLGVIAQPEFKYEEVLLGKSRERRVWKGLKKAAIGRSASCTACWILPNDFLFFSREKLVDKLTRFNAKVIAIFPRSGLKSKEDLEKIEWLRKQGYIFKMAFGGIRPSTGLLPGTEGYKAFFDRVKFWAPKVDIIGCDEWFLSPALAATQGGRVSYFTQELLEAFCKFADISMEDALWVFKGKNKYSNDPRAVKAWTFCEKIQNDIMREFVRVAKKANPKVKTWISYITHNWNKHATTIDSAVADFDEILDCQTYWYGRYSDDPLNAAKITNAIGSGKLHQCEYPDKFLWMGFGPRYAGGKPTKSEKTKWQNQSRYYHNTPEEIVPYLATLYASSDGVFVFTVFNGYAPGEGSDDDFADVFRLVSNLVPRIKDHVKSDIAYYYDPQATWEIVRKGKVLFTKREGNRISVGFLQQFCDVDVTKDVKGYKNVVSSGILLPSVLDYEKQNLYFMYQPEYSENGQKVSKEDLAKLGIKGFFKLPSRYYRASGDVEIEKVLAFYAAQIKGADKPLRKLNSKYMGYVVGAQNKQENIRLNSFFPPYTRQNAMRKILKKDLDYFGWTKRDCPQINGTKDIVAVSFREPRTAVVDFGDSVRYRKVKIVVFNGTDGVIRNEVVKYNRGMKVELPPLNVLVASGIK